MKTPVSRQRTPETRRAACCVKAGPRAFAEHRETLERRPAVFPTPPLHLSDLPTESQPGSPKRGSRPRMESLGMQGTVMLTVKLAQDFKELKGTNSILSVAS